MYLTANELTANELSSQAAGRNFREHQQLIYKRTDRMFAALMALEWLAAVVVALWVSPKTWAGALSQIHPHVWAALMLGGLITLLPVTLALTRPGSSSTRYIIAVGQMLIGVLLIHLSGGRIETHFHVFGSLAFLAFYRDWRVLVPATLVVVADHLLRGLFWPQSVYGVLTVSGWRTLEHAGWVVFEDVFLIISCVLSRRDMLNQAIQSARRDASENRFRSLITAISEVVWTTDAEGRVDDIPQWRALTGQTVAELEGFGWLDALHPDDRERTARIWQEAVRTKTSYDADYRIKRADGHYGYYCARGVPVIEDGIVREWVGICLDITARKRSEVELLKAHEDLENRVEERTAELAQANEGLTAEILERKQAKSALLDSQERYRDLIENAHDIIYTHDLEGNYTSVNKASERITGYTQEESLKMNLAQVVSPECAKTAEKMRSWKLREKPPSVYEMEIIAKDGRIATLEVNSRLTYQDGKPSGVQGIARDITERKRAEAERQVISEIVTGIITTSNLGELLNLIHHSIRKVLYAENCYVALYENKTGLLHLPLCVDKYDPVASSMKLGNGLTAYVFRAGRSMLLTEKAIQELITQGEIDLVGTLPAVWLGVPLRTPAETVGVLVVQHYEDEHAYSTRDLEFLSSVGDQIALAIESKRMEERLRQSEEKYRTILESIEDGYFEVDLDGTYSFLNEAFCRISERSEDELLGYNYKKFFTPDLTKTLYDAYSSVYKTGKPLRAFEYEITRKDGTKKFVEESVTLKRDAAGHPIGFMGIRRDCTERKQIGAELEKARDAAIESARLKSEFLANMSHEIRTPMNGVIGMTGLLLDTELTTDQREFAETISSSGDALLTIINDILDFSKMEAGKLQFERLDFDLGNAVECTVELLAERAFEKGIELASLIHSDVTTRLCGDPGRLRQVLTNLIGNALKFTKRGEVIVQAEKESETDNEVVVRFSVSDTGIGIAEAVQRNLFQAFTQADGSTTRKYGGTGLGLAISKQLVELMGGQIGLTSTPGQGSTFWFTARFDKQPAGSVVAKPQVRSLDKLRALIVNDNATSRKIFAHQLSSWGIIHEAADSGARALELLRAAAAQGTAYDLAILDFMMPGIDGFELARAIKADPAIPRMQLVLLTSYGQRGDGTTARETGVAAYLTKPVRQSQLFDCLARVTSQPAEINDRLTAPAALKSNLVTKHTLKETKTISQGLVLVAEDNLVNQKITVRQLQKLGYRADAVADGRAALEAVTRIPYHIVLMDCQMPEMDGYEATVEIRRREGNRKHTMIVAMTAHALEGDREKCLSVGMDDYIAKPVKAEDLARVLERVYVSGGKSQLDEVISQEELVAPVDLHRLYESMGEEPEELFDILGIYLDQMSQSLKRLDAAIESEDAGEIDLIAHNCCGVSANCGMTAVVAPLRELERMGRENCLQGSRILGTLVSSEFERIKAFLGENLAHLAG